MHDVLPQVLWTMCFLKAQGIKVNGSILYQDNKSAMLLEQNGLFPVPSAFLISRVRAWETGHV